MRSARITVTALLVALAAIASASGAAAQNALERLDWLQGEWERTTSRGAIAIERWRPTAGIGLVGESVMLPPGGGSEVVTEALLLVPMGDGVFYVARPRENPYPVAFRLVSADGDTTVFENPTHDYPQRIVYRRTGPDTMTVWIEGPDPEGNNRRIDFDFRRR